MKAPTPPLSPRVLATATLLVLGGGLVSCSLPPREAWQRIREEGILRAFMVPKRRTPLDTSARLASSQPGGPVQYNLESNDASLAGAPALPTAEPFPGRPGFVYSPRTKPKKLVNVRGFAAGEKVLCPYTLEPFLVPDYGQATALAGAPAVGGTGEPFGPRDPAHQSEPSRSHAGAKPTANPAVVEVVSTELTAPMLPELTGPAYGIWVEGKPGFVYSPFAAKHQLVDVAGIAPGVEVKCPYTGRIFRVPEPAGAGGGGSIPALPEPAPSSEPSPPPSTRPAAPMPKPAPPLPGSEPTPTPTPAAPVPPTPPPTPAAPSKPVTPPAAPPPPTADAAAATLPTASWVDGRPGLVQSPFGKPGELVDVSGVAPGGRVICPFTNKPFRVPAKR